MIHVTEEYVETQKAKNLGKPRLSDLYGMSGIFRQVFRIPNYIPISYICLLEHGVNFQFEYFYNRLLESENELVFLDNGHRVKNYELQTGKKAFALGPLFPQYRRLKGIEPDKERVGTLAFPAHSSSEFNFSSGYRKYAEALQQLPKEYHPITVCLYYYDVLQGHHAIFEQAGFEVVTNGYIGDFDFVEIFYGTIRRFRYTTSNHTGSYAYYSLEMGIPFFLYGEGIDEEFRKISVLNGINMDDFLENEFFKLFTESLSVDIRHHVEITAQQKKLIAYIEDNKHVLTQEEVRKLVLHNWIQLLFKKAYSSVINRFNKR
ncbi:MAG: hypothetical protein LCH44_13245 [Bacteroidetes bacterium]|nr:hypothetical protein [Bacteroidota bacterium]